MSRLSRRITWSAMLAITAVFLAPGTTLRGSGDAPLAIDSTRVTINGTSNIHPYSASTTSVRLTQARISPAASATASWTEFAKPGELQAFELAIDAASLRSGKESLDRNMHKALKAEEFRDITFRLVRIESPREAVTRAVGVLRIAGVEREIVLDLTLEPRDATLVVKGQIQLLMTDFGIAPPKAMLGMLKTDPKVTVFFETVLSMSRT